MVLCPRNLNQMYHSLVVLYGHASKWGTVPKLGAWFAERKTIICVVSYSWVLTHHHKSSQLQFFSPSPLWFGSKLAPTGPQQLVIFRTPDQTEHHVTIHFGGAVMILTHTSFRSSHGNDTGSDTASRRGS